MRGKIQLFIVLLVIASCLTFAASVKHKTSKHKKTLQISHIANKHHASSKMGSTTASESSHKAKKSSAKVLLSKMSDDSNTTSSNSTSESTVTETITVAVTEDVYELTLQYSGPSVSDYAQAAISETAQINGAIQESHAAIESAIEANIAYVEESFAESLANYSAAVTNASEELIEVVETEAAAVDEAIDAIAEDTASGYNSVNKQLDMNLNQTLSVEKLMVENQLESEQAALEEMLAEITELALENAAAATSSTTSTGCYKATNCSGCIESSSCGWCPIESICVEGDEYGPLYKFCSYWNYDLCSSTSSVESVVPVTETYPLIPGGVSELNALNGLKDEIVANIAELEMELANITAQMAALSAEVDALAANTTNTTNTVTTTATTTTTTETETATTTTTTTTTAETTTTTAAAEETVAESEGESSEIIETSTETTVEESSSSSLIQYNLKTYPATQKALRRNKEVKRSKRRASKTH